MARVAICLAFLFASLFCAEAKGKKTAKFDAGGVEVSIDMSKAKFKIHRRNATVNETDMIEIEWREVTEVDAEGKEVKVDGGGHSAKHSIKDFKKQEYNFTDPSTVDLCPSDQFPNVTASATATKLSFSSTINGIGHIKVDTFIVEKGGVAGPDEDDLWMVSPGDMKFNVELSGWKFCGQNESATMTCKDGSVGEFVDVVVKIKGKKETPALLAEGHGKGKGKGKAAGPDGKPVAAGRKGKGKKTDFDMGDSVLLMMTNLVEVDNNITQMPEGYPKVEAKGKDTHFTFRFPKFNNKVVYDPLLTTGEKVTLSPPLTTGGGAAATGTVTQGIVDSAGFSSLSAIILGAFFTRFF